MSPCGPRLRAATLTLLLASCCLPGPRGDRSDSGPRAAGAIEGEVVLGAALPGRRMEVSLYPDLRRPSPHRAGSGDELRNVVVYLERVPTAEESTTGTYVMSQQDGSFVPHVLPVPAGSVVEFPNADEIYHNVFSLSRSYAFDLGRYPRGTSRSVRFDEPGVVKVFCHIHSDMSGVVLVLPNRFFAIPDAQGRLRIDGIPPGEYTVVGWHERAPRTTRTVRVVQGETTRVRFEIPLSEQSDDPS